MFEFEKMLLPAILFRASALHTTSPSHYYHTAHGRDDSRSFMDPQADTSARLAGTPAKATRNAADSDAETTLASTPSADSTSADKAMLLSSPAAFSAPRKHPPPLSSKPRKATSLFRHPASEADKKGNDYKSGASSPAVTHEDAASKGHAYGVASYLADASAAAATTEQDGGGARTHGAAAAPALSWDGRSGGGGEGSSSGSGGIACFGSPARPPRENPTSFRFTPQRNLNGLFASPVPPTPPLPPAVAGDDLPLGLGNNGRKEASLLAGPTDNLSMLRFPRRVQQAPAREPSAAGGAAPCRLEAQPPSPPPPAPQSQSQWQSPSRPQVRPEDTTAAHVLLPQGSGDEMEPKDKPAPASPEEVELELEEAVAEKDGGGAGEGRRPVAASEVCVSNEALRSSDGETMCTLEVLVKHTRERVGVSALECWRVAELKRRLVYLKLFTAPEAIALLPRLGGPALEDDVPLGTLDVDATYEARTVTISAASVAVAATRP